MVSGQQSERFSQTLVAGDMRVKQLYCSSVEAEKLHVAMALPGNATRLAYKKLRRESDSTVSYQLDQI